MSKNANVWSTQTAADYLTRVRALTTELGSAIGAIEKNDLARLQNSVAAQETLCGALSQASPANAIGQLSASLRHEIRSAHAALAQQNRVYAALLRRSHHSAGLLMALYSNYGQGYGKDAGARPGNHTLSCEG